jgi:hypothetical protein
VCAPGQLATVRPDVEDVAGDGQDVLPDDGMTLVDRTLRVVLDLSLGGEREELGEECLLIGRSRYGVPGVVLDDVEPPFI